MNLKIDYKKYYAANAKLNFFFFLGSYVHIWST
jgi:hypothetical protein